MRRRPANLQPIIQTGGLSGANQQSDATSISDKSVLDKTVQVDVGNGKSILISPDNLTVVQQIGQGQYGVVEKVRHNESGHQFAVKRVALKPGDERSRLLMDVDILVKSAICPNIIKFYGALLWDGDLWVLMELMDCSLYEFYKMAHKKAQDPFSKVLNADLKFSADTPCTHFDDHNQLGNCVTCNPIPETILGRMASDIVNALSYLYSIKVIHRDIKPSNILINKVGTIKLCDFGISGYLINSVARTYEAGCRHYMAPERIDPPRDRTGYDIKSDVWSFGLTMLEIAIGRYPYPPTRDILKQLKFICNDEPPRLPEKCFSSIFQQFIGMCLQKDYQNRPKFDVLNIHPFVDANRGIDIGPFIQTVLA